MSNNSRKKPGIAGKLILTIIPLMTITIIILMIANYTTTKNSLMESAKQTLHKETDANVNTIETFVESTLASLNRVYDTMKTVNFDSEEDKLAYITTTCDMQPEIPYGVYIGDNTNYWLDSSWVPYEGYQVAEQSWYQEGLTHESFAFGAPYIDANTSGYIVSATALLSSENGIDAVISADVELKTLSEEIAGIRVMDSGYCFLVDTGTSAILAHKDTSLIGKTLSTNSDNELLKAIAPMATATEYTMKNISCYGSDYMIAVEPIENTEWILVSCIDQAAVLAPLTKLQLFYTGLSILFILFTAIMIFHIIRVIIAPVKTLTKTISDITDGDFSVDIAVKGNDEISVMSNALKEFVEIMREVITDILTVTEDLSEQAKVSKEVAATLKDTAAAQSESMGEMMMTVDRLTAILPKEQEDCSEEIRASMETFADTALELTQESADVAGCADIISESAFTLAENMRKFKI